MLRAIVPGAVLGALLIASPVAAEPWAPQTPSCLLVNQEPSMLSMCRSELAAHKARLRTYKEELQNYTQEKYDEAVRKYNAEVERYNKCVSLNMCF